MLDNNQRLQEYYINDKYRGFYKGFHKLREQKYKLWGQTTMTFTNGEKEFFASGPFKEVALEKIFNKIDAYLQINPVNSSTPALDNVQ